MKIFDISEGVSRSIFTGIAIGMLALGIGILFGYPFLLQNDTPQTITAYTDGVLGKNNTVYSFSFQFQTIDEFVEQNLIQVNVYATLPDVTADCVKVRFEGAANYASLFTKNYSNQKFVIIKPGDPFLLKCPQTTNNEIVLYPIKGTDAYLSNQTLTLQYGMNGNWGMWYINPEEKKANGDYVPNIIHISPADTLVQLNTNRSQNHFNIYILSLTFIVAGAAILQILIGLKNMNINPQSQADNPEKCSVLHNSKKSEQKYISNIEPVIDTMAVQESTKSNKTIVKNGKTYYPDGRVVDSHGAIL